MTATLAAPPATMAPADGHGGAPARRAIRRWAWRLLRREWRQQVLILALLALAVGATTVGLGLVVSVRGSDRALFGSANSRIDIANPGVAGIAANLAATRQRFGTVEAIAHEQVPVPGSITPIDLRAQDPNGVFGAPMLRLVSGHYPSGAGQAAVTAAVDHPVRPEDRFQLVGERAGVAHRRDRGEPEGSAGRVRPGRAGATQCPVQPHPALRRPRLGPAAVRVHQTATAPCRRSCPPTRPRRSSSATRPSRCCCSPRSG